MRKTSTIVRVTGALVVCGTLVSCNAMKGKNDGTGAVVGGAAGGLTAGLATGLATGNPALGLAAGLGGAAIGAWAGDQIQGDTQDKAAADKTQYTPQGQNP